MKYLKHVLSWLKKHPKRSIGSFVVLSLVFFIARPKPLPPLETTPVTKGKLTQSITATGTVSSATSVDLAFPTSGKLVYLGVKKGDTVQPYQTIASLDQRTTQKNLEAALRDYAKQRNAYEKVQDENADRSPDQALTDATKRILENNQYDLDKAILSVELQSLAKEQSVLVTPIGGVVVRADVATTGVTVGPTTTFTIADTNNLVFQTEVDEADIGKIHENQIMEIRLEAYPENPIRIPVTKIDFASHKTSTGGTVYNVEGTLPTNSGHMYRIGMTGDAEIVVNEKFNVLSIPLSSVIDDTYVYIKKDKTYEKKKGKTWNREWDGRRNKKWPYYQ